MNGYKDSFDYDDETEGVIESVDFCLGRRVTVMVRMPYGDYTRYEDLPTPEGVDYEDFWSQFIGHRIHIHEKKSFAIEVFP